MSGSAPIPIMQVGLGPIGLELARFIGQRGGLKLVAAVDVDPALSSRCLAEIAEADVDPSLRIEADLAAALARCGDGLRGGVALVATGSSLEAVAPTILELVDSGLHVVSSCEQLSYPWKTLPQLACRIDGAARDRGVAVLGTGVNPGFLMDLLPVALSGVCRQVRHVYVERCQDAAQRRLPFQKKVGAGLDRGAFEARVKQGTLRHVGLSESMHMIAAALGWGVDRVEDIVEPVLAQTPVHAGAERIPAGHARGVLQTGRAFIADREVIRLIFRAAVGEPRSYERIRFDADPPVDLQIDGGIHGDVATTAMLINATGAIAHAAPGLRTMIDIAPPPSWGA